MSEEKVEPQIPLNYETPFERPVNLNPRVPNSISWTVMAIGLIAIGWVLTLASRAPFQERRNRCASNLHQIGLEILLYSQDNNGSYPDSLATLMLAEPMDPSIFVCPASSDTPTTAPSTQAMADDMSKPGHVSYIYLGKGLTDKTVLSNQIIAYEPLANHGDGIDVLLSNGTSRFVDAKSATKIISDANAGIRPVMVPP
jgi:hypothetical protein